MRSTRETQYGAFPGRLRPDVRSPALCRNNISIFEIGLMARAGETRGGETLPKKGYS